MARRTNPATTGAVVVNPRRKRRSKSRRRSTKRRNLLAVRTNKRRRTKRKSRNSRRRGHSKRRRSNKRRTSARRRSTKRRRSSKRRNLLAVRTNKRRRNRRSRGHTKRRRSNRRRRNLLAVRTNKRRRSRKSTRRNGRSRRSYGRRRSNRGRRRNPSVISSARGMFSKIPFIGGILGAAMGFVMTAVYGGVGVLGTSFVAKKLAPFVPWLSAKVFYPIAGLILAALTMKFLPIGNSSVKRQIAAGLATGGVAIAAYKMVTGGGDDDLSGEYGNLAAFGDGYAVIPGYAGPMGEYQTIPGYGDDDMGAYQVMYGQEAL